MASKFQGPPMTVVLLAGAVGLGFLLWRMADAAAVAKASSGLKQVPAGGTTAQINVVPPSPAAAPLLQSSAPIWGWEGMPALPAAVPAPAPSPPVGVSLPPAAGIPGWNPPNTGFSYSALTTDKLGCFGYAGH